MQTLIDKIVDKFKRQAVESGGIRECLNFSAEKNSDGSITAVVRGIGKQAIKTGVRTVDTWMMIFIDALDNFHPDHAVQNLRIELEIRPKKEDLESFRRRLSYLALNNGWSATLIVAGEVENIYNTWKSLLERPSIETLRKKTMNKRQDNNKTKGKIEKNFQTWLTEIITSEFSKGVSKTSRPSNERLCVLGEDFIFGKGIVLREFPTGAFDEYESDKTRVLPKYWVDLVTVNRNRELSLIELKINDKTLEVLSQSLDYALFFSCYVNNLSGFLSEQLGVKITDKTPIVCYIVNNQFDSRFSTIASYFAPRSKNVPFSFRQVLLGSSSNIEPRNKVER
jgi:hypothetical protein